MTAASSNDANPDGSGLLEPLPRERGIRGKWGLLVALLAVAVIGWQWHSAHRAEQTRRKLAATERMVELEQQSAFVGSGGNRLHAALGTGDLRDWQRAAVSLRTPEPPTTEFEGPGVLYREITDPWFAELERKLRAAAGALAADDGDWEEVDAVLDQAAALLARAEAAEARIAKCLASQVWIAGAACVVEDSLNGSFQRACWPWLASTRAALLSGDDRKLDVALANLSWLFDQPRLNQIGGLRVASESLARQLADVVRKPAGATGDGPSAWLLTEAAEVEGQWARAGSAVDIARWRGANARAQGLLEIAKEAKLTLRRLESEESKARGVVPLAAWRNLRTQIASVEAHCWSVALPEAELHMTAIVDSEEQRSRWLAEVETTKDLRARWQQVPEAYRKQVAPDAEARLAEAVANESMDLAGFQAAQAAMALATTAAGVIRKLEAEESNARGVVPVGIWRAQFAKVESLADCWRRGQMAEADALLKSIADSEEQRARWLAEVGPTKEMRKRWMQVPEAYRKQVAPDAEARLAEAVANESIDLTGFQAAQAAMALATTAVGVVRKLEAEEGNARGLVPVGIWRAQFAKVESFADCWRRGQMEEADALLKSISGTEEQRARWLAEVAPTKALQERWAQVPEVYRNRVAPSADAALVTLVASDSMDFSVFHAVRSALAIATKEAGDAWLTASLLELPERFRAADAGVAMEQYNKLASWFGDDDRLKLLRESHASAVARAVKAELLLRRGLAAVEGSDMDANTGYPQRVIHRKTGIELVLIPAGAFMMGSPPSEVGHHADEGLHRRVIRRPFYMGVTEVTQAQWCKVMGKNPSRFKGDDLPVDQVGWQSCRQFLRLAGDGMRLPSEAEWEYACRAGTTTPFAFGRSLTTAQANYDGGMDSLDRSGTVPVRSLPANGWGLHEMHGNLWEWCEDVYAPYPSTGTEAPNVSRGANRVLRGGGWFNAEDSCRSAFRYSYTTDSGVTNSAMGFRVVLDPPLP